MLSILTLVRPRQWIKNVFVAAPLFFTPDRVSTSTVIAALAAFVAFSLVASAIYCLNDLRDREADLRHPVKRNRPLAAGSVKPATAALLMVLLSAAGAAVAILFVPEIIGVLAVYVGLNVGYSLYLKTIPILDVLIVAFGFVLRIEAGAVLIDTEPSAWILIVTGLLALFIALAKRRDDLTRQLGADHRKSLDGYSVQFLDSSIIAVLAMLLVSYLIFTTDLAVMQRFGSERLYVTAPFVIAGVLRYLQLTMVHERSGSPTDLVYRDPWLQASIAGWLSTFVVILYL